MYDERHLLNKKLEMYMIVVSWYMIISIYGIGK